MPVIVTSFGVHVTNWHFLLIISTEDEIILGRVYPDIRIPKEEISVNPSTDYWTGAVEVTIYTPAQGSFADRTDCIRLYEE